MLIKRVKISKNILKHEISQGFFSYLIGVLMVYPYAVTDILQCYAF